MDHIILAVFGPLAFFGGIAGVIAAAGWARAERIRVMGRAARASEATAPQDAVLAELKALKQQIGEMQSTSHQFDLSFDEALTRLERRVSHLEAKTAIPALTNTTDEPSVLRNGLNG